MLYQIFDIFLESTLSLPELPIAQYHTATLSFKLFSVPAAYTIKPEWLHHWTLPDGQISISSGRTDQHHWLRFPDLADFKLNILSGEISCYRHNGVPDSTISHLLLDQVIPRLLSHQGRPVLHASCVKINNFGILFLGESGWGKSTIGAFFHKKGYPLLTDDCILLELKEKHVKGIPGYSGARLWEDSLQAVASDQKTSDVSHYSSKKRIIFPHASTKTSKEIPIKSLFILNNPSLTDTNRKMSVQKITGAATAIELVKHCFSIDITDKKLMANELKTLALLCGCENFTIFKLSYKRSHSLLPELSEFILNIVHSSL